jgi:hypothetical protein
MSNVRKPVGDFATFHAEVHNEAGEALTGYTFAFTSDVDTVGVVDAQDATVTGSTVETVTVTATTTFPDGSSNSGTAAADFFDNVPVSVVVTAS